MKERLRQSLSTIVAGIGRALVIAPGRTYLHPAEISFRLDAAYLRHDAKKIHYDLAMQFKQQS